MHPLSTEDLEIIHRVWEACERQDRETVFALYDPAIVWEWSTTGPDAGVYHGHDGVRQAFREWLEAFATYQAHPEES